MLRVRNSRGDTIIEVTLALTILSTVLVGSYTLMNRASRLGIAARERTQAVAYVQQQAEIIRAVTKNNWNDTYNNYAGSPTNVFHAVPDDPSGEWVIKNNEYAPDTSVATYEVSASATTKTKDGLPPGGPEDVLAFTYTIAAKWEPVSSGPQQTTAVVMTVGRQ
jgi:Tfp pilus assembly protein PilV